VLPISGGNNGSMAASPRSIVVMFRGLRKATTELKIKTTHVIKRKARPGAPEDRIRWSPSKLTAARGGRTIKLAKKFIGKLGGEERYYEGRKKKKKTNREGNAHS